MVDFPKKNEIQCTLSSITAANGSTSKTELIASHTSLPSVSPNFPRHSLIIHKTNQLKIYQN
jgi:hypothetical protein